MYSLSQQIEILKSENAGLKNRIELEAYGEKLAKSEARRYAVESAVEAGKSGRVDLMLTAVSDRMQFYACFFTAFDRRFVNSLCFRRSHSLSTKQYDRLTSLYEIAISPELNPVP